MEEKIILVGGWGFLLGRIPMDSNGHTKESHWIIKLRVFIIPQASSEQWRDTQTAWAETDTEKCPPDIDSIHSLRHLIIAQSTAWNSCPRCRDPAVLKNNFSNDSWMKDNGLYITWLIKKYNEIGLRSWQISLQCIIIPWPPPSPGKVVKVKRVLSTNTMEE